MKSTAEVMDAVPNPRWKVEPCEDCGSMKPRGARYHAPLMHSADVADASHPRCKHGTPYYRTCRRVVPPPCCWDKEKP